MARIQELAVKDIKPERLARMMLVMSAQLPSLASATYESLALFMSECARRGVMPDKKRGMFPILFRNKDGSYTITPHLTYQGLVDALYKRGVCKKVQAEVVYQRDTFHLKKGDDEGIEHVPYTGPDDPGPMIGAYAIFTLSNGEKVREWVPLRRLDAIRESALARSKGSGPWVDRDPWMYRKTALIQGGKLIPMPDLEAGALLDDDEADIRTADLVNSIPVAAIELAAGSPTEARTKAMKGRLTAAASEQQMASEMHAPPKKAPRRRTEPQETPAAADEQHDDADEPQSTLGDVDDGMQDAEDDVWGQEGFDAAPSHQPDRGFDDDKLFG